METKAEPRRHTAKLVLLALVAAAVVPALTPWTRKVQLPTGRARIAKASFARSLFDNAFTTISYFPEHGGAGTIVLWQDLFDGPIMVLPGAATNTLLCLYDYDTCFRLFRIHTDQLFKPLPAGSDLLNVLFTCTWQIEEGTTNWDEVFQYLQTTSPTDFEKQTVSVGVRPRYDSPSELLSILKRPGSLYAH